MWLRQNQISEICYSKLKQIYSPTNYTNSRRQKTVTTQWRHAVHAVCSLSAGDTAVHVDTINLRENTIVLFHGGTSIILFISYMEKNIFNFATS